LRLSGVFVALLLCLSAIDRADGQPRQGPRVTLDSVVEQLAPGTKGVTETYFVGFAGDGRQRVFGKEIAFAHAALARRLKLAGRSIQLANSPDSDDTRPLATLDNLRYVIEQVAARMNRDEDVLILFLTSHGSRKGELAVNQPGFELEDVSASDVKALLDQHGIRWRIIIVSSCYSGTFVDRLRDSHSLIATASRRDRNSFGCGDDSELTYFGEALFRDSLPEARTLRDAIWNAHIVVDEREMSEGRTRSEPQLFVGQAMYAKLEEIPLQ
jgi:hypothetical protein